MSDFFFIFLVGTFGYWIFRIFRLPLPGVLGSLVFAGTLNLIGLFPDFPVYWLSWFSNIIIGSFVGLKVKRNSMLILKELAKPALVVSIGMLFLSLAGGFCLYFISNINLPTAMLGSSTGGTAEMALLALSLGEDAATVTLLQVFRLMGGIFATPIVCRQWTKWSNRRVERKIPDSCPIHSELTDFTEENYFLPVSTGTVPARIDYAILAIVAISGSFTGYFLNLPVGIFTGAMFAVAIMNIFGRQLPEMPSILRTTAQIGVGTIIASNITPETIAKLSGIIFPVFFMSLVMIICSFLMGFLLHKMTGWNYPTCLLSTSLGGISQMSIISEEMGADPLRVSLLQAVRLLSILVVLPFLFVFFFK